MYTLSSHDAMFEGEERKGGEKDVLKEYFSQLRGNFEANNIDYTDKET